MKKGGRYSADDLATSVVESQQRPDAPYTLTDSQADIWRQTTATLALDWFNPENLPLLEMYCRHIDASRKIGQLLHEFEQQKKIDIDEYDKLLKMQEREGRAASSLATRLRITPQTTYEPRKKKERTVKKLWSD